VIEILWTPPVALPGWLFSVTIDERASSAPENHWLLIPRLLRDLCRRSRRAPYRGGLYAPEKAMIV
jgi:hypothetical protein